MTEEWEETKLGEGGKRNSRYINADRLRGGKESTKVVVDYVDGGEVGMSRDNGVKEGIDGGKGGGVGSDCILDFNLVSPYCHAPKDALEGDQEVVLVGRMTGRRHLRVIRSLMSSCSSASAHSLPCWPRVAEEKVRGWPAPSRFKSDGSGEGRG
jgi:hypothetical protein